MAAAVKDKKQSGLSKPLSLKKSKKSAPVKRTLNLMVRENTNPKPSRWIPGVLVVLILAALFGKFAVMDRFDRLNEAEAELAGLKAQVDSMRQATADYDQVRDDYNKYNFNGYDRTIVDRLDVLELLKREVYPVCRVGSLSIAGKTVSMTLSGLTLDQVSELIASLKADPLVDKVNVSTTGLSAESETGTANMTLTLVDATTLGGEEQ